MNIIIPKDKKPPLAETPDEPSLGDNAWHSWDLAMLDAVQRTRTRGCAQQVRKSRNYTLLWIVQDVR